MSISSTSFTERLAKRELETKAPGPQAADTQPKQSLSVVSRPAQKRDAAMQTFCPNCSHESLAPDAYPCNRCHAPLGGMMARCTPSTQKAPCKAACKCAKKTPKKST